ncbi:MAG TPA: FHA domain-containing protein [Cyanophyceae cyanobacterium]
MPQEFPEGHQIIIEHRLIVNDERGCREYILSHSTYSIGKAPRADIRLYTQSPLVAPHHASLMLVIQDGISMYQIVEEELESSLSQHGLLVNGNRIQTHLLQDGETITFAPGIMATYHYTRRIEPLPDFFGCILFDPKLFPENQSTPNHRMDK